MADGTHGSSNSNFLSHNFMFLSHNYDLTWANKIQFFFFFFNGPVQLLDVRVKKVCEPIKEELQVWVRGQCRFITVQQPFVKM